MKKFFKKWLGIDSTTKQPRFYILVHVFRAEKFIGQYTHEVPANYNQVAGIIVRIDPRTERNIQVYCSAGVPHPPRLSLVEGYDNDVELRVMQFFSI